MSESDKPTAEEQLQRIEDALLESLLNASPEELREEISAAGGDPDALIADVEATIAAAKAACARQRLQDARAELAEWRDHKETADTESFAAARDKLQRVRSGDKASNEKMMLAARKEKGLSDSDFGGLLEDLVDLEKLEGTDEDE
ncbi:MAG TPA: hypothetical protein PKK10_18000 [Woeseiaceae bacterium]|nr:hypothetical protein [Woeseiaceae bacterium]